MSDVILVLNAGSSSLKFTLFEVGAEPTVLCGGQISGIGTAPRFDAKSATASETHRWDKETSRDELLRFLLGWVQDRLSGHRLFAAGHRVVHGGDRFAGPVRIDAEVLAELGRLEPLAPLHQPHNLFPISTLAELHPGLPQVACFDTACPRSPASTRPSTGASPRKPAASPCPASCTTKASSATASTACPMNTSPVNCAAWRPKSPLAA
jgi:acetate kinase